MNIDNQTPRELLNKFYSDNNLGVDGGENSSSVKIELTPRFHFYFPNFNARRKAVLKHDIHHLLTEYTTNLSGESEISAWEIASGCKSYWFVFLIDTSGVMLGLLFNYWGTLKAFSRGRKTKNLYQNFFTNEQLLDMKISELRKSLNLHIYTKSTQPAVIDFVLFSLFIVWGVLYSVVSLVLLPFILFYTLYVWLKNE